jgi:TonB family protein
MFVAFLAAAAAAGPPKATAIDLASWFHADDYPAEALDKGLEGRVSFEVDVDPEGRPTACRIALSSGSAILDQKTCDIVMSRAKFKPAKRHGIPVSSHYSESTVWRIAKGVMMGTGYIATIVDFSTDPPTCTIAKKGDIGGPTCEQSLPQLGAVGARQKLSKLVFLVSISNGTEQPYRGEKDWGQRTSFVAMDLYTLKGGAQVACSTAAVEGIPPEAKPCAQYSDANLLSEEEKRNATHAHIEQAMFGIVQRTTSQGKCKSGESAAEVHGCV